MLRRDVPGICFHRGTCGNVYPPQGAPPQVAILRIFFFYLRRIRVGRPLASSLPANGPLYSIADMLRMSSMGPPLFKERVGWGEGGGSVAGQEGEEPR